MESSRSHVTNRAWRSKLHAASDTVVQGSSAQFLVKLRGEDEALGSESNIEWLYQTTVVGARAFGVSIGSVGCAQIIAKLGHARRIQALKEVAG